MSLDPCPKCRQGPDDHRERVMLPSGVVLFEGYTCEEPEAYHKALQDRANYRETK